MVGFRMCHRKSTRMTDWVADFDICVLNEIIVTNYHSFADSPQTSSGAQSPVKSTSRSEGGVCGALFISLFHPAFLELWELN